ncbi:FtsX-like permease family protein [Conexibacter arvalis]|uniref:Putative ABC transport system permease protein n=1 Tax=Conexibacter arvalis TaxID=912552 RepID=A0A840I9K7_9ACTN|nr:FtsX-like permease family protein [Conexibacter arvalis]MBB4660814.1 putative ABC transport system permease protein [Conexibacter arvalis]
MRLEALLYFYGRRLRTQPVQELLAGLGIAIGVALTFAVLVANSSVAGSAEQVARSVVGTADLQVAARGARGLDEQLLAGVRATPGVVHAAPLLEQRAVLRGPGGRSTPVNLVGIDREMAAFSGRLAGTFVAGGLLGVDGIVLPLASAQVLGIGRDHDAIVRDPARVDVEVAGRSVPTTVAATLGREAAGPLAEALVAIVPLERAQRMTGLEGRVSRVIVETAPGREEAVREHLESLADDRFDVTAADAESALLRQALGPGDQATSFFAAISALLGFLLAFNAMLLTSPERRRLIAELRMQGFRARQLVVLVLFQAGVLGLVSSAVGVLGGSVLARGVFDDSPDYLSPPFTLGTGTLVGPLPVIGALVAGMLACALASAPPLLDLRRGRAVDAALRSPGVPGNALTSRTRRRMLWTALGLTAVAGALLAFAPEIALLASGLLAIATVLLIPSTFAAVLTAAEWVVERAPGLGLVTVALFALRATTLRSLALAATGGVAVFGSVTIGGARDDLLRGIANYADDYVTTADLWIVNPADNQGTSEIRRPGIVERVAAVDGVREARPFQGSFLDAHGRRLWVIARPSEDPSLVPRSQLVDGDLEQTERRLRDGGWVVLSDQLAEQTGTGPGGRFALPTPSGGVSLRVAATTTNLGWAPGTVIVGRDDFARLWGSDAPTSVEVSLEPGADLLDTRAAVERAIGADSGLQVLTAAERIEIINASARQGLDRLDQIATLLLVAAVLAMAAAMSAAIWQRRVAIAALRIQSFTPRQLWALLLIESGVVLAAGCLTGAVLGLLGQVGADRYLRVATGFPVSAVPASWQTVEAFTIVVAAALAVVAIPGWFASRADPSLGLQE